MRCSWLKSAPDNFRIQKKIALFLILAQISWNFI